MSTSPQTTTPAHGPGDGPPVYDLALFERLNEEYRDRPLAPTPPAVDQKGRRKRARRRLRMISRTLDVTGKRVLEIGSSHGDLTRLLVKKGGAREAIGVDVVASPMWEQNSSQRVSFHRADLAREPLLEDGSVDAVISSAVLEHVDRPLRMLEAIARVLKVGGDAWLYFNLYRGPKASHRYREIHFPWPHLLFDPKVCEAFYRKHHDRDSTFAWVNRLTAAEYMDALAEAGLHVADHRRHVTEIDLPFYLRFEEVLGRYPALDLETDFLWTALRKRRRPPRRAQSLGYLERQRAFDEEARRWRAEHRG
jgi:ubiquinone/menaquinone biosynthesis C-methylase UbiE